ncbi:RseA family anti-sigma factor [Pseudidiomarina homiensis]|uniref:RseA family anti-sigma factor n=1 Tax=Pseudidiomarina homiensis TaxID=364198 RepID=UPI00215A103F|nr:RseA family anti-sigma factor [Pseudidiomarina homiensis]
MSINTEKLSAFLDNELPAEEMEEVRQLLTQDENAAARLAALVMVDERLRQHTDQQSQTPVPDKITQMLTEDDEPARVVSGPWQTMRQFAQRQVALAASVAMVIGISAGMWFNDHAMSTAGSQLAQAIDQVLENKASGHTYTLNTAVAMTPQLTFKNHMGDYCRHYELNNEQAGYTTTAIHCRSDGSWKPVAEAISYTNPVSGSYTTASGQQMLDTVLDAVMATAPFSKATEDAALNSHWRVDAPATEANEAAMEE